MAIKASAPRSPRPPPSAARRCATAAADAAAGSGHDARRPMKDLAHRVGRHCRSAAPAAMSNRSRPNAGGSIPLGNPTLVGDREFREGGPDAIGDHLECERGRSRRRRRHCHRAPRSSLSGAPAKARRSASRDAGSSTHRAGNRSPTGTDPHRCLARRGLDRRREADPTQQLRAKYSLGFSGSSLVRVVLELPDPARPPSSGRGTSRAGPAAGPIQEAPCSVSTNAQLGEALEDTSDDHLGEGTPWRRRGLGNPQLPGSRIRAVVGHAGATRVGVDRRRRVPRRPPRAGRRSGA